MKKILFFVVFFFTSFVHAGLENSVVRIQAHTHDSIVDTYTYSQFGSGVIVDSDKILTNAHVVLDEDWSPIGNYEICFNTDFRNPPTCGNFGWLLFYDIEADLALLQVKNDFLEENIVEFEAKDLELGENVYVYGYPQNGGETITRTVGSVSGSEDGVYKLDANLDAGNSGGATFNEDGKLIGIPTFVSEGYSTLGYMISVWDIIDFLEKKGNIETYPIEKEIIRFSRALAKNRKIYDGDKKITTDFFTFHDWKKQGFTKGDFVIPIKAMYGSMEFFSVDQSTKIGISYIDPSLRSFSWDSLELEKNMSKHYLRDVYDSVKIKDIAIPGIHYVIVAKGTKDAEDEILLSFEGDLVSFQIQGYLENPKYIFEALRLFLQNFSIKESPIKESVFFWNLELSTIQNIYVLFNPTGHTLSYDFMNPDTYDFFGNISYTPLEEDFFETYKTIDEYRNILEKSFSSGDLESFSTKDFDYVLYSDMAGEEFQFTAYIPMSYEEKNILYIVQGFFLDENEGKNTMKKLIQEIGG